MVTIKTETQIMPPTFCPVTGMLIEPGRPGQETLHILDSDDEAGTNSHVVGTAKIKQEYSLRSSPEIKSEGEEERSATMSLESGRHHSDRVPPVNRKHRQRALQLRTSVRQAKVRRPPTPSGSSNDSSNDSSDDSSDDDGSTPSSHAFDTSSTSSDFDSNDDDFRPSRSPSRFPGTPSPTTRSQSRVRPIDGERAKSMPRMRPIEVIIPSVQRDASGSVPSRTQSNAFVQDSSPAGSVRHGWRCANKSKNRAKTPAGVSYEPQRDRDTGHKASSLGPGRGTSLSTMHPNNDSRHVRAATAGPSSTSSGHRANHHSMEPRQRSPKGKERAVDQDPFVITGGSERDQQHDKTGDKDTERKKKRRKNKEKKIREQKITDKANKRRENGKGKAVEPEHHESLTRRPPRQARIEPSIERAPTPGLPTPEPSSSWGDASRYYDRSPGMFVSSPPQPATPGPSRPPANRSSQNVVELMSSPSSLPLVRAGIKRRHVDFIDLETPDAESWHSTNLRYSLESRLSSHQSRLDEHQHKYIRLEEILNAQVARFVEEVDRQNERLAEAEASRNTMIEVLESLKQQFNDADARGMVRMDALEAQLTQLGTNTPAPSVQSQHQGMAAIRSIQGEVRPREYLDLGRRTGMNDPRPPVIPTSLVRGRPGAIRQPNAVQNVTQQRPSEQYPPDNDPNSSSLGSGSNNNSEGTRNSTTVVENASRSHDVAPLQHNPGPAAGDLPNEPAPGPGNVPPLRQKDIRDKVFNFRRPKRDFEIPYDENTDRDQTSRATIFLLTTSEREVLWPRFEDFIRKPDFFDVNHPDNISKGCWVINEDKTYQNIHICYRSEVHQYTLQRLAVRLWHNQSSVLRLLSAKTNQVHTLCQNKRCLNPQHIVVESKKQYNERDACRKAGRCIGHKHEPKIDNGRLRKACIFPRQRPQSLGF